MKGSRAPVRASAAPRKAPVSYRSQSVNTIKPVSFKASFKSFKASSLAAPQTTKFSAPSRKLTSSRPSPFSFKSYSFRFITSTGKPGGTPAAGHEIGGREMPVPAGEVQARKYAASDAQDEDLNIGGSNKVKLADVLQWRDGEIDEAQKIANEKPSSLLAMGDVGRRAAALFNKATAADVQDQVAEELSKFLEEFQDPALATAIDDIEYLNNREITAIFGKILTRLNASDVTKDFVNRTIEQGRVSSLDRIVGRYIEMVRAKEKTVNVEITYATREDIENSKEDLPAIFEQLFQKDSSVQPNLSIKFDPTLLGGFIVRTGDSIIDNSYRVRFNQINEEIQSRINETESAWSKKQAEIFQASFYDERAGTPASVYSQELKDLTGKFDRSTDAEERRSLFDRMSTLPPPRGAVSGAAPSDSSVQKFLEGFFASKSATQQ